MAVLDFTSLYPTVVIANNICYTTVIGSVEMHRNREPQSIGVLESLLEPSDIPPDADLVTTWTKCSFIGREKRVGVMPLILTRLLSDRRAVKAKMKSKEITGKGYHSLRPGNPFNPAPSTEGNPDYSP